MKAAETVIHLRREEAQRVKHMVPAHIWNLVRPHGFKPSPHELNSPRPVIPIRSEGP
jgi:coenzyme F420 hydrogenase subunit beta